MDRTCLVSVRPTSVWTWQTNSPLSAEDTAVMLNSDPDGLKDPVTEYRESFFSRLGPADRTFRISLLNCNSGFQHFIILRTVMMAIFKRVFPCSKNWIECSWCENATLFKAELGWLIWPQVSNAQNEIFARQWSKSLYPRVWWQWRWWQNDTSITK